MPRNTRPLWEEVFAEDSQAFLDYYYTVKTRDNRITAEEENGEVVSMIHWNPYPLCLGGTRVDSRYLIAVATKAAFRHQGRMRRLLHRGLLDCAGEGIPFVWLMPASAAIYEPFDFRYIYDKVEGVMSLPQAGARAAGKLSIRPLEAEEYPRAAAFLQEQLLARFDVFAERTPEYLRTVAAETASEGGGLAGVYDGARLAGVLSYWPGEESMEIRELVTEPCWEQGEGREALVSALAAYFQPWGLPVTAITTGWLGERRPIIMARLTSLRALMPLIRFSEPTTLTLRVRDSLIPENDGVFCWWGGPGQPSRWERADGSRPELELTIAELADWVFGRASEELPQLQSLSRVFLNEIV